jgi:hypothetical protein
VLSCISCNVPPELRQLSYYGFHPGRSQTFLLPETLSWNLSLVMLEGLGVHTSQTLTQTPIHHLGVRARCIVMLGGHVPICGASYPQPSTVFAVQRCSKP